MFGLFKISKKLDETDKFTLTIELLNILDEHFKTIFKDLKNLKSEKDIESYVGSYFNLSDILDIAEDIPILKYIAVLYKAKKLINIKSREEALYYALRRSALFSLLKTFYELEINDDWFNSLEQSQKKNIINSLQKIKSEIESLKENKDLFNPSEFDFGNFSDNKSVARIKNIIIKNLNNVETNRIRENLANIERLLNNYWKVEFFKDLERRKDFEYRNLYEYFNSNEYKASLKHFKLNEYYVNIIKEFEDEAIFHDPKQITLKDIYIKPYYRIYKENIKYFSEFDKSKIINNDEFLQKKNKEKITDLLERFIKFENLDNAIKPKNPNIILILGYAGEGKTSLTKKLFYDWKTNKIKSGNKISQNVFLVELRRIDNTEEFFKHPIKEIENYLNEVIFDNEYKINIKNSIIILDGLDELLMSEDLPIGEAERLIINLIEKLNFAKKPLNSKFIITSRYGYINLKEKSLESELENNLLVLELVEFNEEQQKEWLKKYKKFYPEKDFKEKDIENINRDWDLKHIEELISQPILLYMIASLINEEIKSIYELKNKNESYVYGKLFEYILKREWDNPSEHKVLKKLKLNKNILRSIIRELAFHTFISSTEYLVFKSKKDIAKLETLNKVFENLLKIEQYNLKDILKGLLIAFYLREVNIQSDREIKPFAIEFLHKSLYEYLTAEYIFYKILELPDLEDEKILNIIWELFSHKKLTREVKDYFKKLIEENREQYEEQIKKLLLKIPKIYENLFKISFIVKPDKLKQKNGIYKPLFTFGNLWIVLKLIFKDESLLEKINREEFIELLRLTQSNKISIIYKIPLTKENLKEVSLKEINLRGADLSEAYLNEADLKEANLSEAVLIKSYLIGVNLKGTNLARANLSEANLSGAYLNEADLRETDLSQAYLIRTDLIKANLIGSDLKGANLTKADLRNANLNETDLREVNLRGAYITKANLREADLSKADLREANLIEVNLIKANLSGAILTEVDLSRADLIGINLNEANLSGAYLTRTDLRGADLTRANLRKADLKGAHLAKANLREADLSKADLREANLIEVNLIKANLSRAILSGTSLSKANLTRANLRETNLTRADLSGADLKYSNLSRANLIEANFSDIKNIETAIIDEENKKYLQKKYGFKFDED